MALFADPHAHQPRAPANPRLLKALATCSDDLSTRQSLYEALLNSTLVIPTRSSVSDAETHLDIEPLAPGRRRSRERKPSGYLLIEDESGAPAVPAFTDISAMQRWQPGSTSFIAMPLHQMLRESFPTTAAGIWLNIADRAARFVSRAELARITGGMVGLNYAQQVQQELAPVHSEFDVRLPEPTSALLHQRIVDVLLREPEVAQGYLLQIDTGLKGERLAIGLRLLRVLDDAVVDAMLRRVASAVNGAKLHRGRIEVFVLDYERYQKVTRVRQIPAVFERR